MPCSLCISNHPEPKKKQPNHAPQKGGRGCPTIQGSEKSEESQTHKEEERSNICSVRIYKDLKTEKMIKASRSCHQHIGGVHFGFASSSSDGQRCAQLLRWSSQYRRTSSSVSRSRKRTCRRWMHRCSRSLMQCKLLARFGMSQMMLEQLEMRQLVLKQLE